MSGADAAGDWRHLFARALAAAPGRLHFAAHSHHLWPDASYVGQLAAWQDAARLADHKWDRVMGELWPAAQAHVAHELRLPDPATVAFAGNTHDWIVRLASAVDARPIRILATDGEFHSFARQAARWAEAGAAVVETVPAGADSAALLAARAAAFAPHLILVSQVMFGSGAVVRDLAALAEWVGAECAGADGPLVVVDGYHGFMAMETDWSPFADRLFYMAGGYKYAMAGEGIALIHAPPGRAARPAVTGWYAAFEELAAGPGTVGYAADARRLLGATFDPSGLYRFVAVRDMLAGEGLDTVRVAAHAAALRDRFLAGIDGTALAAAELLNPPAAGAAQARFLALRSPQAARWQAELLARDIVTDVRGDVLRIGFGLYQTARDVDQLIDEAAALSATG